MSPALRAIAAGCAVSATSAVLAQSPAPAPQAPAPQFRGGTVVVPVEVRVVDRRGQPVTDLRQSDFTILEDRVPQKITQFVAQGFVPEPPAAPGTRPRRASDAFEFSTLNQRTFLIVLGRGQLEEPSGRVTAAIHLVRDRLMPQDRVAVMFMNKATDFTTNHEGVATLLELIKKENVGIELAIGVWSTGLARTYGDGRLPKDLRDRIDRIFAAAATLGVRSVNTATTTLNDMDEQIRRTSDRALGGGSLDPIDQVDYNLRGGTVESYLQSSSAMLSDLQALYGGIEYLRGLAGQRHLIFISEAGVSPPRYEDDRALARRAADARVSLDFIHGRGMSMFTVQTSNYVTKLTGGQFFASQFKNDSEQIDRIELATRFQYILGYSPPRPPIDGKYRRLEVRVNRPGVTVLTRDGYLARPSVTPLERKSGLIFSRVASAAEYQFPVTDLAVTATAAPLRPRAFPVTITIDLSRVAFDKQGSRNVASIEVAVFAVTKGEDDAGHSWQTLELNYSDERLAQVRADGLRHEVTVTTTRSPSAAKVVVYDYNSDLLGTAVVRVAK